METKIIYSNKYYLKHIEKRRAEAREAYNKIKPIFNSDSLIGEIWRDVVNYEGYYQVSNLGRIKSVERKVKGKHTSVRVFQERIRHQYLRKDGYTNISLTKNSKTKNFLLHRLIALAFIPNPKNHPCINHINGNKKDNAFSNMEWTTALENIRHARRTGLNNSHGENNKKSKLKADQVLDIKKELLLGVSQAELSIRYNISDSAISDIYCGVTWKSVKIQTT